MAMAGPMQNRIVMVANELDREGIYAVQDVKLMLLFPIILSLISTVDQFCTKNSCSRLPSLASWRMGSSSKQVRTNSLTIEQLETTSD